MLQQHARRLDEFRRLFSIVSDTGAVDTRYLIVLLVLAALGIITLWRRNPVLTNSEMDHHPVGMEQLADDVLQNLNDAEIDFAQLNHIAHLDPKYLPGSSSDSHSKHEARKRRLIFIGDIHGCQHELEALLIQVDYNPSHDHIVALGDVINKGPKSKEVVQFLMQQGASCLRGNHEDEILSVAKALFEPESPTCISEQNVEDLSHSKRDLKLEKRKKKAQDVARSFTRSQLRWLQNCPVILQVGEIKPFGNIIAVHGGLVPGVPLDKQDPQAVMNMRIIDVETRKPSKKHSAEGSVLWFNLWHDYQKALPRHEKHTTVVYGHDKKKGAQIHRFTKGLDTGCVDHGKLTAWVVGFNKDELVHVNSNQHTKD